VTTPDQGWDSWLSQRATHQPFLPIPEDAPGGPAAPSASANPGSTDSGLVASASVAPPAVVPQPAASEPAASQPAASQGAAPDATYVPAAAPTVAAPDTALLAAAAAAMSAPSAATQPTDSGLPVVTPTAPQGGSVFTDSGAAPFGLPAPSGSSASTSDSGGSANAVESHYAAYGWYVVPSIGNDPGYMSAAAENGESWGFADAGYAVDWYFV
jgi:hypothetical protein